MWPRVIEVMLGLWLWLSPFILRYPGQNEDMMLWIGDYLLGFFVIFFALASYSRKVEWAHYGNSALAVILCFYGYVISAELLSRAGQNHILVGLLILMFSILPNRVNHVPYNTDSLPFH